MTIRELLSVLVQATDLDQEIQIATSDGAELGTIDSIIGDYLRLDSKHAALKFGLILDSFDAAVLTKAHALRVADGDEESLQRLRDSGVMV